MIGKTISHYRIIEKIGAGGMGVVFKAEDTSLRRTVALKFLPPVFSMDQTAKQRFIHEARAASSLDHPNICTIFEIDETGDGQSFIAMAYYEGESLKEKIENGPLDSAQAVNILTQILHGLERAHETGIVHRDIKPANIMITGRGEAKILDFGLAKLANQTALTQSGSTLGTMAYMSPEQIHGKKADRQSDIWACGVVMYEMLTGSNPFVGEFEQAIMYSILNEKPTPVDNLPDGLWQIIEKSLDKDIELRYQNVTSILQDIENIGDQSNHNEVLKSVPPPEEHKTQNKSDEKIINTRSIWIALIPTLVIVLFIIWSMTGREETTNGLSVKENSQLSKISPVIQELVQLDDTDIFMEKINTYRNSMRIIVGNKGDFDSPSGCYVFVLDDKRIEAAMQYQNEQYINLNSGERISDLQLKYEGKKAVWVREVGK
jgi:serine/threonine protein kinase